VRSGELIEPGFVNDRYSAFYPLGAASPVFRSLGLDVPWRHGPLVLAHPGLDGSCAVLERGGAPAARLRIETASRRAATTAFTPPCAQVRGALQLAFDPGLRRFLFTLDENERRLREGNALHTDVPPWSTAGRWFGLVLTMLGRTHGYPCVAGGSGVLTRLLA